MLRAGAAAGRMAAVLAFPSFCRLCGRPLEAPGERAVCRDCVAAVPVHRGPRCESCGDLFDGGASHPCARCLRRPSSPLSLVRSAGRYRGPLKDLVLLCKFHGLAVLAGPLSEILLRGLGSEPGLWDGVDALVPVPLHPRRRRERGFNQAEAIARRVARRRGLPVLGRGLVRRLNAPPQSSLGGAAREANVRGAFAVRRGARGRVRGRTLLLVDDVCTTGATLRSCARALRAAGAREVRGMTVARA